LITTVVEPSLFSAVVVPVTARAPVGTVGVTSGVEDVLIVSEFAAQATNDKPVASNAADKIIFRMSSSYTVNLPAAFIEHLPMIGAGEGFQFSGD
jgi:hypothetical protein